MARRAHDPRPLAMSRTRSRTSQGDRVARCHRIGHTNHTPDACAEHTRGAADRAERQIQPTMDRVQEDPLCLAHMSGTRALYRCTDDGGQA